MRIVISRKGFDSTAGGAPSPIVDGRPVSLPIPANHGSITTYEARGLGALVEAATRGRLTRAALCHDDPLFADGACWFGQCDAAQGHLRKQGVGAGDVFVFFGLFADPATGERHHRFFGHMRVACHGSPDTVRASPVWREPPRAHPHLAGAWNHTNTIYYGPGAVARHASPSLRLTRDGGPLNRWTIPAWLRRTGLTYHDRAERWIASELDSAKRGQEFVAHVGDDAEALAWLEEIIQEIER
jgi:hypothetical protein